MLSFSANLGFLWTELELPRAIHAARSAGFDAVECHFPYAVDSALVAEALAETGLAMLGLNTRLGSQGADDFGLLALPGRESEARDSVEEAIAYAQAIDCPRIHCMAGRSGGALAAETVYRENLAWASKRAGASGLSLLIEPINQRDVAGYHLSYVEQGIETIESVGADNLKLMFDCYHTQIMQGDLLTRLRDSLAHIGHVQFAGVPDRGEPDEGEVNYAWLLPALESLGWTGPVGAEYRPRNSTEAGLGWLAAYRSGCL